MSQDLNFPHKFCKQNLQKFERKNSDRDSEKL